jgi:ribose 5-phosphate isomerase B
VLLRQQLKKGLAPAAQSESNTPGGKIEALMKISIGADHAGYALKQHIIESLRAQGHQVDDVGTHGTESTDYPDYGVAVARAVADGLADRGIVVCATGVGISIAANKVPGIRAALAYHPEQVQLTRQHNDANVLAIGAKFTDMPTARQYVKLFLDTPFEGGRHARRVNKISELEKR